MSDVLGPLRAWLAFDALEQPAWVGLAAAIAVVAGLAALRRTPAALAWPAWPEARAAGAAAHDRLRRLGVVLRTGAVGLLGIALAGPVVLHATPRPPGEGLDLVLVVDASGSMRAIDAEVAGRWRTRLDLAREVVARFARHRVAEGDRVGLVVFGQHAFTQCPLTSDGELVAAALEHIEAGVAGEATALGDALALAVRRVGGTSDPDAPPRPSAGRVVVVLSDGRSNAGVVPLDVSAALARAARVRVHTVGIGSEGEVAVGRADAASSQGVRLERHDLDADALRLLAAASGGRFFLARRSRDLEAVYAEIDALERVPRRLRGSERREARPDAWLALAGLLVVVELAALQGPRRRLP